MTPLRRTRPCLSCKHPRTCRWVGTAWMCRHCTAEWDDSHDPVLYAPYGHIADNLIIERIEKRNRR